MKKGINCILGIMCLLTCFTSLRAYGQTELVADINPQGSGVGGSELVLFNNELYFSGRDDINNRELWKSDGTSEGTVLVKEIRTSGGANPESLTVAGSYLFFTAFTDFGGPFLFRTDGTSAGTLQVGDNTYSSVEIRAAVGDQLYFTALKFVPGFGNSTELYVVAGSGAPLRLTRYAENGASGTYRDFIAFNNKLYMAFELPGDDAGVELYESDGTFDGTKLVADIYPGLNDESFPEYFTVLNDQLLFAANSADGEELWITDGTTSGTTIVKDIVSGTAGSSPRDLVTANNRVFFSASTPDTNRELFVTDGTSASTTLVKDIRVGAFASGPNNFVAAESNLFFEANTDMHGSELWYSDGTESGTILVKDINPGTSSSVVDNGYWYNGNLYFKAGDGTNGFELWVSDGTEAGTQMFADIYPGSGSSTPTGFIFFDQHIYFIGTGLEGRELRRFTPLQGGGGNTNTITGFVFEEDSNDPGNLDNRIANVTVTNRNSGLSTSTNSSGEYSIEASDGDSLSFEKDGYNATGLKVDFALGTDYAVAMQPNPCVGINCPLGEICFEGNCYPTAFVSIFDANTNTELIGASITNLNNGFSASTEGSFDYFLYEVGDQIAFQLTGYISDTLVVKRDYDELDIYLKPAGQCDGISCSPELTCFKGLCELVITGKVTEAGSNFPVNGALVENLTVGVSTYVDLSGAYTLPAEAGDQVRVTAPGFEEFVFILPPDVSVYNIGMIDFGLCDDVFCPLGQVCYNGSCYDPVISNTVIDQKNKPVNQPLITDVYTRESFRGSALGTFELPEPDAYLSFSKQGYKPKSVQFEDGNPIFVIMEKELCTGVQCPLGQLCHEGRCYDPLISNQANIKVIDSVTLVNISGITIGEIGITGNEQITDAEGEVTIPYKGARELYTYDPTGEYQNITFSAFSNSGNEIIKLFKAGCENVNCAENDACYRGICGAPQATTYSGYIYRPDSLVAAGVYFSDNFDATAYSDASGYFELTTPIFFDSIAVEATKTGLGKFFFYLYPNQTNILQAGSIDPCSGVQCPLGQVCHQGSCYDPCVDGDPDCTPADNDLCEGTVCPDGQICYQGSCHDPCFLDDTNLCADALDQNSCDGVTCPLGMVCENGACIDACANDDTGNVLCYDNTIDPCENIVAPPGYTCINGVIVADCPANPAACAQDNVCNIVSCLPGQPCFQCNDPSGANTSGTSIITGTLNLQPFNSGGRILQTPNQNVFLFLRNAANGQNVAIARSDENGGFIFENLPAGNYELFLTARGYYLPAAQSEFEVLDDDVIDMNVFSVDRMIQLEVLRAPTSTEEWQFENKWYPVPNLGEVFLLSTDAQIEEIAIYTLSGTRMTVNYRTISRDNHWEVQLSQRLNNGVYLLKWKESGKEADTQTIVVMN